MNPQRTVAEAGGGAGGGSSGAKPYANYNEYQADLRKARETSDQTLLTSARARLKASPWYTGKRG